MKFEDIVKHFGNRPWFDFEMVWLLSGESEECIHTELYRWREAGKIIELRRGMFLVAKPWSYQAIDGAALAEPQYSPSYLSGSWALEHYGVLESRTSDESHIFTSITPRPAKTFINSLGTFNYSNLPKDLLYGVNTISIGGSRVKIALPEKAMLDFLFTAGGEWDHVRLEAMGFNLGHLNLERLEDFAEAAARPRLIRATRAIARRKRKRDPARSYSNENYMLQELRENIASIQALKSGIDCEIYIKKVLMSLAMKALHEAGAFASVCLTHKSAMQFFDTDSQSTGPLECIRTSKGGYNPEQWLFKMQRYIRYRGLETRIAFARKAAFHTGWIKLVGLFDSIGITFIFTEAMSTPKSEISSACIDSFSESFAIRFHTIEG